MLNIKSKRNLKGGEKVWDRGCLPSSNAKPAAHFLVLARCREHAHEQFSTPFLYVYPIMIGLPSLGKLPLTTRSTFSGTTARLDHLDDRKGGSSVLLAGSPAGRKMAGLHQRHLL